MWAYPVDPGFPERSTSWSSRVRTLEDGITRRVVGSSEKVRPVGPRSRGGVDDEGDVLREGDRSPESGVAGTGSFGRDRWLGEQRRTSRPMLALCKPDSGEEGTEERSRSRLPQDESIRRLRSCHEPGLIQESLVNISRTDSPKDGKDDDWDPSRFYDSIIRLKRMLRNPPLPPPLFHPPTDLHSFLNDKLVVCK